MEIKILAYLIIFFSAINLFRMSLFLIGSDIYGLQLAKRKRSIKNFPKFSVVIPAYNESNVIIRAIKSILASEYPKNKLEVIVVDDGSTDNTADIVNKFIKDNPSSQIKLITQKNLGKASALNLGIKNFAIGELITCLDADSTLDKMAFKNAAMHFDDPNVVALASNIKILKGEGLLNLVQRYEYLLAYQMKRAESLFNCEYIIGGIGSTFRKSVLEKVGHYDTNTVTEDIDLTMKILQLGNRKNKVIYAPDVVSYTESVLTVAELIKQRFRWKWGRSQTFLKNTNMFFSNDEKFSKSLSWFYLPFAIYGEISYLIEPILLFYILAVCIIYKDPIPLMSAWIVVSTYMLINIFAEDAISLIEKIELAVFAPLMYVCFYILSFVEYVALVKTIIKSPKLRKSLESEDYRWTPVERQGTFSTNRQLITFFPKLKTKLATVLVGMFAVFAMVAFLGLRIYVNDINSQKHLIAEAPISETKPVKDQTDTNPELYTVKPGESLWTIARNYYGRGAVWTKITTPDGVSVVHPGEVIELGK